MERNLIIIGLSLIIVSWCIYVHKNRKSLSGKVVRIGRMVFIMWTLMIGLPNVPVIIMPFTPTVYGHISGQPGSSCNIKAFWVVSQISLFGGHRETYAQFSTKTDAEGNFVIPRKMKALAVLGFLPRLEFASGFGGTYILAYTPGYPHSSDWGAGPYSIMPIKLTIQMYFPGDEHLRSEMLDGLELELTSWNLPRGTLTTEDKAYLLEHCRYVFEHFDEIYRFAKSNEVETALIRLGSNLSGLGDYKTAIQVSQKRKIIFPNDTRFADNEINRLKGYIRGGN
jgi:hypothetical protein